MRNRTKREALVSFKGIDAEIGKVLTQLEDLRPAAQTLIQRERLKLKILEVKVVRKLTRGICKDIFIEPTFIQR